MKAPIRIFVGFCLLFHHTACGVDSDGDGKPDITDQCPTDPNKITPGQCGCNVAEGACSNNNDTDGDGTQDQDDKCPVDPLKIEPDQCGCGISDDDDDGDGTANCIDVCPKDPDKVDPGECGCNVPEGSCSSENQAPLVQFIHPGETSSSADLGVVVQATDSDGLIVDVVLYINDTLVREESQAPYEWGTANSSQTDPALLNLAPGVYHLKAEAIDDGGAKAVATLSVTVEAVVDQCPDDPNKTEPGECGCGTPEGSCSSAPVEFKVNQNISVVKTLDHYKKWNGTSKAIIKVDKMPNGTQNGDLVVMLVGGSGGKTLAPEPSGTWKLINKVVNGDIFIGAYYKVQRSSDPTSFQVGAANKLFVSLTTLRGLDTTNPVVDSKTGVDTTSLKYGAIAPSVSSVNSGALLCGFAMDNPVKFKQGEIQNMKMLTSYGPGWPNVGNVDDSLTVAIESTAGGATGKRTAKKSNETGHCNESTISISFKP